MKKWDVVLLSYPYTDGTQMKKRPALVVSPDVFNQAFGDGLFMAFSSQLKRRTVLDIEVSSQHPEFRMTGLKVPSMLLINKIWTLEQSLIVQTLGRLGPGLQQLVENRLTRYFQLPQYLNPPLPGGV